MFEPEFPPILSLNNHETLVFSVLSDCSTLAGGRCYIKVDTIKDEKGSRYDLQTIERGCTNEVVESEYCTININKLEDNRETINRKQCLSHCDR